MDTALTCSMNLMPTNLNIPIPPDKIGESFAWRDWFQRLSNKVYGSLASQNANTVAITGGTITNIALTGDTVDSSVIGGKTPAPGTFTALGATTLVAGTGTITTLAATTLSASTGSMTTLTSSNLGVDTGLDGQVIVGRTSDHHFVPATLGTSTGLSTTIGAGTLTLNNTGVTSIVAGSNITVSSATGAVTINASTATTGATGTFKSGDLPTAKTITVTNGLIVSIV